jgi:hypothetical protein
MPEGTKSIPQCVQHAVSDSNRYVKVNGHNNWFLVLEANSPLPVNFSKTMHERILRTEVYTLHGGEIIDKSDFERRIRLAATQEIDYEHIANKYGTILIRPIGSYMPLRGNEIIDEKIDNGFNETHFPLDDSEFGEVVICENDKTAEHKWVEYLKSRFPNKTIATINFFDLRTDDEVSELFKRAKFITFSTTFSKYEWFEKLTRHLNPNHKVIGFCHNADNWEKALTINSNVEIVSS